MTLKNIHFQIFVLYHAGLKKKLSKKSKMEPYKLLSHASSSGNTWIKSITNHLYWVVSSTEDPELRVARWKILIDHIRDIHTQCDHGPLTKKWVPKGNYTIKVY
jgi:hypothetical protein